jgi:hypothetical protein
VGAREGPGSGPRTSGSRVEREAPHPTLLPDSAGPPAETRARIPREPEPPQGGPAECRGGGGTSLEPPSFHSTLGARGSITHSWAPSFKDTAADPFPREETDTCFSPRQQRQRPLQWSLSRSRSGRRSHHRTDSPQSCLDSPDLALSSVPGPRPGAGPASVARTSLVCCTTRR